VEVADILASITDVSAAMLDAHVLPALIRDGTLKRTSQEDRYAVPRCWSSRISAPCDLDASNSRVGKSCA